MSNFLKFSFVNHRLYYSQYLFASFKGTLYDIVEPPLKSGQAKHEYKSLLQKIKRTTAAKTIPRVSLPPPVFWRSGDKYCRKRFFPEKNYTHPHMTLPLHNLLLSFACFRLWHPVVSSAIICRQYTAKV